MPILLSDKDAARIERMLRAFDRGELKQKSPLPSRRSFSDDSPEAPYEFWAQLTATPAHADTTLSCKRWNTGGEGGSFGDTFTVAVQFHDGATHLGEAVPSMTIGQLIRVSMYAHDADGVPLFRCTSAEFFYWEPCP